jgi:hypothetical protein
MVKGRDDIRTEHVHMYMRLCESWHHGVQSNSDCEETHKISSASGNGPVLIPNQETAFTTTPLFPKDKADLVKVELVNLVSETGAPLHPFSQVAQWAARANSCDPNFKG